jgi:hypothetical protein
MRNLACLSARCAAAALALLGFAEFLQAQQTSPAANAAGQEEHPIADPFQNVALPPPHDHRAMLRAMAASAVSGRASAYLLSESSGTSRNPESWTMPMVMTKVGEWDLMWMGQAFVVDTQQSGPRGGDKLYSANWGMLGAVHKLGGGAFMLRGMASLEPLTVTDRRYPLLFQSGETAFGKALVDGQHPHDLVMELSAQYAHPFSEHGLWTAYYAPVGDAALGPVAFPHRASAMEIPQATLGHHWEDSTHIAVNVATVGANYSKLRIEASGFHGGEPNENRWNFDIGSGGFQKMDSWSSRVSYALGDNWLAQTSYGNLHDPEAAHFGDVHRWTSSLQYTRPLDGRDAWSSTFLWARNYKTDGQYGTQAVLAETVYPFSKKNLITGRFEWSQRDELFENDPVLEQKIDQQAGRHAFRVNAYTMGYTREVGWFGALRTGVGANVTAYGIASAWKPYYGEHPAGVNVFLRIRLQKE